MAKTRHQCEKCLREFTSKMGLAVHFGRAHRVRQCPVCGPIEGHFGPHLRNEHPEWAHIMPELQRENEWRIQEMERMERQISDLQVEIIFLRPQPQVIEYIDGDGNVRTF